MRASRPRHILLTAALLVTATVTIGADRVRVARRAEVTEGTVLLRDIATLHGPEAEALGDLVVANFDERAAELSITVKSVRALLTKRRVNWARLTLGGHSRCQVQLIAPAVEPAKARKRSDAEAPKRPPPGRPEPQDAAPTAQALPNPAVPIELDTAVSLEQQVVRVIERYVGGDPANLVVQFSDSDRRELARSALTDRYLIEPLGSASPGRMPILIRRWQGEKLLSPMHVRADVARRRLALVATTDLRRGHAVTRHDVTVAEILARNPHGTPLAETRAVVGKVLTGNLRRGAALYPSHVRSPLLVHKRETITVSSRCGGVEIVTHARAMEDGERGQLIRVRRLGQRQDVTVRVTARQRAETVPATAAPTSPSTERTTTR